MHSKYTGSEMVPQRVKPMGLREGSQEKIEILSRVVQTAHEPCERQQGSNCKHTVVKREERDGEREIDVKAAYKSHVISFKSFIYYIRWLSLDSFGPHVSYPALAKGIMHLALNSQVLLVRQRESVKKREAVAAGAGRRWNFEQ